MAFVGTAVGAVGFGAVTAGSTVCSRSQPASTAGKSPVRMAFSSIDKPGEAITFSEFSVENKSLVVDALYKQLFGNAYVMESERAEMGIAESKFREGEIELKEFAREIVKSQEYRKRFFETCGPYRFVELNCKHILGRGPSGQEEISFHVRKLAEEGYEAEMDSYFDDFDYDSRFGLHTVPRFIFQGAYVGGNDQFNRMCVMRKYWDGCSTSTRTGSTFPRKAQKADLTLGRTDYVGSPFSVAKGIPPRPVAEVLVGGVGGAAGGLPLNPNARVRMRIEVAENLYQVYEIPAKLPKDPPRPDDEPAPWNKPIVKTFSGEFY